LETVTGLQLKAAGAHFVAPVGYHAQCLAVPAAASSGYAPQRYQLPDGCGWQSIAQKELPAHLLDQSVQTKKLESREALQQLLFEL
jgi:hypothetical protein